VDPEPVDPEPVEPEEPYPLPLLPVPRPLLEPPVVPVPLGLLAELEPVPRLEPDEEEEVPSLFMLPAREEPLLARFVS